MNYLIFDAEKTYNYGYIVVNEKGETLLRQNLILTNNFENRNIVGENTYKRKLPIYKKDPDALFISSAEAAELFSKVIIDFDIKQIISHNINEDRRQLEHLREQTGIDIPYISFYDSINLIKILFPNNTQTGLEAIISDITGLDVKQTHTALADCDLLLKLVAPIIEYIPYFIKYDEIFAHDNDYEITQNFFTHFNDILPFPVDIKEVQSVLNMDSSSGDKRKVTNFVKKVEKNYKLWNTSEGANGSLMIITNPEGMNDATTISALYTNLKTIAAEVVGACTSHQLLLETDESIIEKLNAYKATHNIELEKMEEMLKAKEKELIEKEKNLIEKEKIINTPHVGNICKACGNRISKTDKFCNVCGAKNTKPLYKRIWFWVIIFIVLTIGHSFSNSNSDSTSESTHNTSMIDKCTRQLEFFDGINADAVNIFVEHVPQFETKYSGFKSVANKSNTFSLMLNNKTYTIITSNTGEVITIINDNTGNCIYGTYKETTMVKPESEKKEEVPPTETEKENTYTPTLGEKNALREAETYLSISAFSKESLIKQLKYAGYNTNEIDYAISNCNANYNEECYEEAETYLNISTFSKEGLIKQLKYEGYTQSQIDYALNKIGY